MPVDLCSSVNSISQYAFGSGFLNSLLGSALSVAFIIAMTMVLLIMFLYPAKKGTPFKTVFKMFVYMFLISLLVIFAHDSINQTAQQAQQKHKEVSEIFRSVNDRDPVYGNYESVNNVLGGVDKPYPGLMPKTPTPTPEEIHAEQVKQQRKKIDNANSMSSQKPPPPVQNPFASV